MSSTSEALTGRRAQPTSALLDELWSSLSPPSQLELLRLAGELERLRERIAAAAPQARRQFEAANAGLRALLDAALTELRRCGGLRAESARDVTTLVRRMYCTIDSLDAEGSGLDPAALEVRYSDTDLAALVRSTAAAFEQLATSRNITYAVEAPDPLQVEVDVEKVEEVLLNLLFNAFKHTPAGGQITVRASAAESLEASIRVSDSGPGIRNDYTEALFQRSRHADRGLFTVLGGIGFSLASSRDLAALQGGTLAARNNCDGAGVTFELRLPEHAPRGLAREAGSERREGFAVRVARVAAAELVAEQRLGSPSVVRDRRALVLVVDDNRSIQRILQEGLAAEYNVVAALDGAEGVRLAETLRPDVILCDLLMPGMDGGTMIRLLRSRQVLADVPVIVLTSKQDPTEELRLLHNGVQDFVHKPFLMPEVQARVQNLVAAKRARDTLSELVDRQQLDLEKLADEVARQQRDLSTAFQQVGAAHSAAEHASQVKSNFLRMMSHELKTPIAAMDLHLHLMRQLPEIGGSPQAQEGLRRISSSAQRLLNLTETMLEWARVESGRSRPEVSSFPIPELLSSIGDELSDHARMKGVSFEIRAEAKLPALSSDRRLVRLLLLNLTTRAVQLTQKGSVVLQAAHEQGTFRLSVRDSSRAMSPGERADLIGPPPELDLRWRSGAGSGLGLYVLTDIGRIIGATVEIETGDRLGNTLTVVLRNLPA